MLLKNMPEYGLVNGSRGVVESFERRKVTTQRENAVVKVRGARLVIALEPALNRAIEPVSQWYLANTSSAALVRDQVAETSLGADGAASQGMTLSRVEVQLANAFEYGQAYARFRERRTSKVCGYAARPWKRARKKAHPRARDSTRRPSRRRRRRLTEEQRARIARNKAAAQAKNSPPSRRGRPGAAFPGARARGRRRRKRAQFPPAAEPFQARSAPAPERAGPFQERSAPPAPERRAVSGALRAARGVSGGFGSTPGGRVAARDVCRSRIRAVVFDRRAAAPASLNKGRCAS